MATITIEDFKANTKEWLIDKLNSMSKDDALQSICNIYDGLYIEYPKTYEECCEILGYEADEDNIDCYKGCLINVFVKLLICRDAYWKIIGEERKSLNFYKPDLQDKKQAKYVITNVGNNIAFEVYGEYNGILAFPTSEIRYIFYNNFKYLIEQCKELL